MIHQYSVKIASPCSEKWNEMRPNAEGRYCEHCQKTVVNFMEMTDNEIATFLHTHKGKKVCGAILPKQTEQKYPFVQAQKTESPVKQYVMAILAGLMTAAPYQAIAINNTLISASELPYVVTNAKKVLSQNSISGTLINKENGKPLAFTSVHFSIDESIMFYFNEKEIEEAVKISLEVRQNPNISQEEMQAKIREMEKNIEAEKNVLLAKINSWESAIFGATTDANGSFSIPLPDDMLEISITLHFKLADDRLKNKAGEIVEGQEISISNHVFSYQKGTQYQQISAEVTKVFTTLRQEEYPLMGDMIIDED